MLVFITVGAHVHNGRCEMTFSWVSPNSLLRFAKFSASFRPIIVLPLQRDNHVLLLEILLISRNILIINIVLDIT